VSVGYPHHTSGPAAGVADVIRNTSGAVRSSGGGAACVPVTLDDSHLLHWTLPANGDVSIGQKGLHLLQKRRAVLKWD